METNINSWGNSLAVRIPKVLAKELGFEENSIVNMEIVDDKLVITANPFKKLKSPYKYTLKDLLAKIPEDYNPNTDEEAHEWQNSPPVGREFW